MGRTQALRASARSGQIIIVAAFALVIFCMLAALAIDVGYMYCTKAELQNAGDAGAVAAALELFDQRNLGHSESVSRSAAETEANNLVQANHSGARTVVRWGSYSGGSFTEEGLGTAATAVQVQALRDSASTAGKLQLFFSPIFGQNDVAVTASAVVKATGGISGLRGGSGLRPFAIAESVVQGWTPGANISVVIPGGGGGCGVKCPACGKKCGTGGPGCGHECVCGLLCGGGGWVVPGNWGWLDFDGGDHGVPELRTWIDNGYDGDITLGTHEDRWCTWITGSTGQKTTLQSNFEALLGQVICLCIYDTSSGEGANGQFRIVGFAAFILTSVDFKGGGGGGDTINGQFMVISNVPYGYTGSGGSPYSNVYKILLVK